QDETGARRAPLEQHGARAAYALAAAVLRSHEAERVPQKVEHRPVVGRLRRAGPSVQRKAQVHDGRPPIVARRFAANSPVSCFTLTFIAASPTEPRRPSTRTSLT